MSKFEIILVKSKKDRLRFIKMAWSIYKNDPHWVPPLIFDQLKFIDPKQGVFFDHGEAKMFLALRDNVPVGRISAHINHIHDKYYNDDKGFFGFFECENNIQTAKALFDAAGDYIKQKGKKYIEGPFSFNIYDEIGILIEGFDTDPYVLNTHNPSYYEELFEKNGFKKSIDWFAFRGQKGRMDVNLEKKIVFVKERIENNLNIKIRFVEKKTIKKDEVTIREIFSEAWEKNWGHLNLTEREWKRIESAVIRIAILPLCIIAEVNGKPAGFALSIYDVNVAVKKMNGRLFPFGFIHLLNFKKTNRFRLLLMGVLEEYRNRGIEIAMYLSIMERAVKFGFVEAEMSLIVETNDPMINSLNHFDVEKYKTYRIFIKKIN